MAKRRIRRIREGALPRAARAFGRGLWWIVRHPQPLVVIAVAAAGTWGAWRVITRSDAFRVTTIQLPFESSLKVPETIVGQNLWAVDLDTLAAQLSSQQPSLKRVRVIRRPPHTLEIWVESRKPVAQVRIGQWYAVAEDGYIFPQAHAKPIEGLVMVKGIEGSLKPGRQATQERLTDALRIIQQVRRLSSLRPRRLTAVDMGNNQQLTFMLDDAIEVRCGSLDELPTHLARLQAVLQRVAVQQMSVRYIDVRFEHPVLGPKTSAAVISTASVRT